MKPRAKPAPSRRAPSRWPSTALDVPGEAGSVAAFPPWFLEQVNVMRDAFAAPRREAGERPARNAPRARSRS